MQIEINNHFTPDGKEFYYWTLYDGPDGIDEVKGFATDLIEVFSKIIEWRERIGADYAKEMPEEMETATKFITTNNETES
jgi:hypothetical protein